MRLFVVISALIAVSAARPEPPSFGGYPPSGGLDSYSPSGNGNGVPSSAYGAPGNGNGHNGNGHNGNGRNGYHGNGHGNGYNGNGHGNGNGNGGTVHKHVYVHVPPPENEPPRPKKVYPPRIPQKHYKIVFIKAPTPPTPTAPELPPVVQDEQKTLIYVLVKRPEEPPEIQIPTPAPTKPSKPEVYFIRYKTQKAEGNGNGNGYPDSGVPSGAYGAPSGNGGASGPSNSYGPPGSY